MLADLKISHEPLGKEQKLSKAEQQKVAFRLFVKDLETPLMNGSILDKSQEKESKEVIAEKMFALWDGKCTGWDRLKSSANFKFDRENDKTNESNRSFLETKFAEMKEAKQEELLKDLMRKVSEHIATHSTREVAWKNWLVEFREVPDFVTALDELVAAKCAKQQQPQASPNTKQQQPQASPNTPKRAVSRICNTCTAENLHDEPFCETCEDELDA